MWEKEIHTSVQSLSRIQLFMTLWTAALLASLSITNSWSLFKLIYIESVMPFNHFSSGLQSFPASRSVPMGQLFAWGGQSYWSFSFSISPTNEFSGLISFPWCNLTMDWLDLLAVQRTLKSILQHRSSKAKSAELSLWSNSHIHTIALTRWKSWIWPPGRWKEKEKIIIVQCLSCFM